MSSCRRSAGPLNSLSDLLWSLALAGYLLLVGQLVDQLINRLISRSIGRLIGWPIGVSWPLVRWWLLAVGSFELFGVNRLSVG